MFISTVGNCTNMCFITNLVLSCNVSNVSDVHCVFGVVKPKQVYLEKEYYEIMVMAHFQFKLISKLKLVEGLNVSFLYRMMDV